jgi:hypothetical protein
MYIIVDDRDIVAGGYANGFDREGVHQRALKRPNFANGSTRSAIRT